MLEDQDELTLDVLNDMTQAWVEGNYRVLTTMANELLTAAVERECTQLDEKLFLELFSAPESDRPRRTRRGQRKT